MILDTAVEMIKTVYVRPSPRCPRQAGTPKYFWRWSGRPGLELLSVCDPQLALQRAGHWRNVAVPAGDEALDAPGAAQVGLINGLGHSIEVVIER